MNILFLKLDFFLINNSEYPYSFTFFLYYFKTNLLPKILEKNYRINTTYNDLRDEILEIRKIHLELGYIKTNLDKKMNFMGGSDQLFFKKMHQQGYSIIWNQKSKVYEYIHPERLNFLWFVKRNLRYGLSGVYIDRKIHGYFNGIIFSFIKFFDSFKIVFTSETERSWIPRR